MLATAIGVATPALAAQELNLYSARHYQTDESLYADFTEQTGIKINRLEAKDEELLERMRAEGDRSPADVVLLVDASRLWKAHEQGLFSPVKSVLLEERIPSQYRAADGSWYAFSSRARVIAYNKANVKPEEADTYAKLGNPINKGRFCARSGSHPYNLSLFASQLEHMGEVDTQAWLTSLVSNMARAPKGGDTDQIRAVASGECGVALTNSYYWARLVKSDKPEDKEVVAKVGIIWPDQAGNGVHMNLSGAGVAANAPNREAAVKFLEYLSSDKAQAYFANGNNEWPVVKSASTGNKALESMGDFKEDTLSVDKFARRTGEIQRLLDKVGFK